MNTKPILFSGEMVRAILEGRKTQTRRVVKPIVSKFTYEPIDAPKEEVFHQRGKRGTWNEFSVSDFVKRCPYGLPGDLLWVREAFAYAPAFTHLYKADFKVCGCGLPENEMVFAGVTSPVVWRPSIHMPRTASRITLEIVNVRVERVKEITRDDAKAEGVSHIWSNPPADKKHYRRVLLNPYIANYSVLWDEINSSRGFGWDVNPWVWVIEFKKVGV